MHMHTDLHTSLITACRPVHRFSLHLFMLGTCYTHALGFLLHCDSAPALALLRPTSCAFNGLQFPLYFLYKPEK